MSRCHFTFVLVAFLFAPGVLLAQGTQTPTGTNAAGGGGGAAAGGGDLPTTEIEADGVRTGPTDNTQTQGNFQTPGGGLFESANGGRGNNARTFNFNNGGQTNIESGGSGTKSRRIRTVFRLGFVPSQMLSAAAVQTRARKNLQKLIPRRRQLTGAKIQISSKVATLRGTVESEDAKRLAAALLMLEPGVRRVDNQLTIAPASTNRTNRSGASPTAPPASRPLLPASPRRSTTPPARSGRVTAPTPPSSSSSIIPAPPLAPVLPRSR